MTDVHSSVLKVDTLRRRQIGDDLSFHEKNRRFGGLRVTEIISSWSGAGDGDRTRDPLLGKQMLYH